MKKIAILGAVAAVVFSSCGTGAGSLKTEQDSLAYAVGLDFGNYVKGVDSTLDVNVIAAGIKAVQRYHDDAPRGGLQLHARLLHGA